MEPFHGTTIVSVRRGASVALGGDGQVTLGNIVVKASARKVRKLHRDQVLAGFAGATADAFTLFERFEAKLEKHQGHLVRAAIELTKDWRTDRVLRRLEAMLAVADRSSLADHHRQRRRARARARHGRHRLGRRLRAGRGAGAARAHRDDAAADRQAARSRSPATCASTPTSTTPEMEVLNPVSSRMTPQEIVSELDRHIVGQQAKRAVAIALRNRWRRQQVDEKLRARSRRRTS
jgi:hypothetical protein